MRASIQKSLQAIRAQTEGPFYGMDLEGVQVAAAEFQKSFRRYFPRFTAAYSFKSNRLKAVTAIMRSEGFGAEVVSGMELEMALADGFSSAGVVFDGPVKTNSELERAISLGVLIQADSVEEVSRIANLAKGRNVRLTLRLAVQYNAERLSRFGLTSNEFARATEILNAAGLAALGVHFHVGTNINVPEVYSHALECYSREIKNLYDQAAEHPLIIDIGGGFPANTLRDDAVPVPPHRYAKAIAEALERKGMDLNKIHLIAEPGRSLVEDYGWLVMPVYALKERDERKILVVEGGLNLARSIFGWKHQIEFDVAKSGGEKGIFDIYGFNCFESDVLGENVSIDSGIAPGDAVIVTSVGAYDIANCAAWIRTLPPVYDVSAGRAPRVIRAAAVQDSRAGE